MVFMTLTERHFNERTFPQHELSKRFLKIHLCLITALLKLVVNFADPLF